MSRPYVCPLCNGAGYLRRVEYVNDGSIRIVDGNTVGEVCHACKGAGIVWSPICTDKKHYFLANLHFNLCRYRHLHEENLLGQGR